MTWWQTFRVPLALAVITCAALASALLGEHPVWRWIAWVGLVLPLVAIAVAPRRVSAP